MASARLETAPDLAFLFATSRLDPEALTAGVLEVVGAATPLFGGNANGVISNDFVGYDGFQAGVAVFRFAGIEFELFRQEGVAFAERETGRALGEQIAKKLEAASAVEPSLLMFYDSVNRLEGHFIMNLATPLLEGMGESLDPWPDMAGARVMGDMKFNPTVQWCGQDILRDAAVALALWGDVEMHTGILHGCRPVSAYHTITTADGPVVLEVDEEPALDWVGDLLGPAIADDFDKCKFFVTLGVNHGDRWAAFDEDHYANKMCVGVDADRRGLVISEPLPAGTEVQLMRRSIDPDYNYQNALDLIDGVYATGRTPFFGMYINCAGRAAAYYGSEEEEATYVQKAVDGKFPVLGAYEAGEITRVYKSMQLLDWSGILNVFSHA